MLLITAFEDTFGYQIVDAVKNNCIPIARNKFAYPELLPREYLYDDEDELFAVIIEALSGKMKVPELLCSNDMRNFFTEMISAITDD